MKKAEGKFPFSMYATSGEGRLINAHTNSTSIEIVEIRSGEANIQIGTETINAVAGDFIYVPPTLVFRADSVSERVSLRGMIFDTSILEANMENFDAEVFYMFYLQSKNNVAPFRKGHPVYETLEKYMQESYDEYVSKDVCYKLPIRANIYLIDQIQHQTQTEAQHVAEGDAEDADLGHGHHIIVGDDLHHAAQHQIGRAHV